MDLEWARIRAIRENAFVVIQFNATGYDMLIDNGTGVDGIAGDWMINGDELLLRRKTLPAGVTINIGSLTLADARVRFNGRGIAPDLAGDETIPLVNKTGQKVVSLNRLGRVTTQ